jgi:DNA-binding NarL/FixJ family response regulator
LVIVTIQLFTDAVSEREVEVLRCVARGAASKELAAPLAPRR